MFESFFPDEYIESTYAIDFEKMYEKGYRGVIFDIDNTLVPHDAPADANAIAFFKKLKSIGFKALVLSNNKEPRVKKFADAVGCEYIYKANKPSRGGYLKAMEKLNTEKNNTLFVGDQLFTDVWGAHRTGIHSILVHPIDPKEEIQIVLKRYLEKIVLHFYEKEN
ncbi:MAG: YqeG family HAD IIIA-type phosphatase [Lachnospiraceae bacterium]|nr:YqeG family HAD IIIA-type phosphatase [Lachnospiraceae bacterium]